MLRGRGEWQLPVGKLEALTLQRKQPRGSEFLLGAVALAAALCSPALTAREILSAVNPHALF